MSAPPLYAVIMAGGSGTRFWPASRERRPKQFLPISGARPMVEETLARLEGLVPAERVLVVTGEAHAELVRGTLPALPPENVLAEPRGRNTGPCVALAALEIAGREAGAVQVVLPADHAIEPAEAFRRTIAAGAEEAAAEDVLVTFGIRPTYAATGYGYVEAGDVLHERSGTPVHRVERFVEKPDRATAERFLGSGRFLWNSGMFVWRSEVILEAFRRLLPDVVGGLERWRAGASLAEVYDALPSIPVDVGILERATNVRLLPIDYRWSDVGSWAALPEVRPADAAGNVAATAGGARLVAEDAEGCIVYAEGGDELVALLGVRDLVVVRTADATLVCPRERAEDVKRLVERLRREDPRHV